MDMVERTPVDAVDEILRSGAVELLDAVEDARGRMSVDVTVDEAAKGWERAASVSEDVAQEVDETADEHTVYDVMSVVRLMDVGCAGRQRLVRQRLVRQRLAEPFNDSDESGRASRRGHQGGPRRLGG